MADSRNYSTEALVLKWVKLRESDAIIKMVAEDGSLLEAVARGVRKPNSASSSRLEVFNRIEVFCANGKGLDVVREARVLCFSGPLHTDPARYACASCFCELLSKSLQPHLDVPKMYGLACKTMEVLCGCSEDKLLCVAAASVLKACSFLGFMPSFSRCVACGNTIDASASQAFFSYEEGGIVCCECSPFNECIPVDANLVKWADAFLHMTLEQVVESNATPGIGQEMLLMSARWIRTQAGLNLKSATLAIELCCL